MTVKTSISLPDSQAKYARDLVERGLFPSLSAIAQHGIEVLRQKDEATRVDTEALKALLEERAKGPFVGVDEFRVRTDKILTEASAKYALGN
jgi:antitoxin ParD1/3/4